MRRAASRSLDPIKVAGAGHLGETGVDEWAAAVLRFPGGIVAEVSCSVSLEQDNVLRIFGTEGRIEVTYFWFASGKQGGTGDIDVLGRDGSVRDGGGGGGPAGSMPSRPTRRARRSAPGGRSSRRRE